MTFKEAYSTGATFLAPGGIEVEVFQMGPEWFMLFPKGERNRYSDWVYSYEDEIPEEYQPIGQEAQR